MNAALVILLLVLLQRLGELVLAARNTAALRTQGYQEVGASHYPVIVAFHAIWLAGLFLLARDAHVNWWFIAAFVILQGLRVWVLATLGRRWTTRVMVKPDEKLVASGPYKIISHPNYAVVIGEIFVLPLAFGFYAYSLIGGLINIAIVWYRISVEGKALRP